MMQVEVLLAEHGDEMRSVGFVGHRAPENAGSFEEIANRKMW